MLLLVVAACQLMVAHIMISAGGGAQKYDTKLQLCRLLPAWEWVVVAAVHCNHGGMREVWWSNYGGAAVAVMCQDSVTIRQVVAAHALQHANTETGLRTVLPQTYGSTRVLVAKLGLPEPRSVGQDGHCSCLHAGPSPPPTPTPAASQIHPALTSSQTPFCTAHIAVVPSKLAVARCVPPGDQQQLRMDLVCVSSRITAHRQPLPGSLLRCHILTVLSPLQLARAVPVVNNTRIGPS